MLTKLKALREEREEGFTLIELLVVILIIGILAAIAIPVFLNQRQTANDGAVQSDVKNAATQVESLLVADPNAAKILTTAPTGGALTQTICTAAASYAGTDCATATNKSDVKLSSGVSLKIAGSANAYTIKGTHTNGKKYGGGQALVYDNTNGGIQSATVAY